MLSTKVEKNSRTKPVFFFVHVQRKMEWGERMKNNENNICRESKKNVTWNANLEFCPNCIAKLAKNPRIRNLFLFTAGHCSLKQNPTEVIDIVGQFGGHGILTGDQTP